MGRKRGGRVRPQPCYCVICREVCPSELRCTRDPCHWYHRSCLERYFQSQLTQGYGRVRGGKPLCPACPQPLTGECFQGLPPALHGDYTRFLQRMNAHQTKALHNELILCAHQQCRALQVNKKFPMVTCLTCQGQTCVHCEEVWTPDHECRIFRDEATCLTESVLQRCPWCRLKFVLADGCNHIHCPVCEQHSCYHCGEKLQPGEIFTHYVNFAGCPRSSERLEAQRYQRAYEIFHPPTIFRRALAPFKSKLVWAGLAALGGVLWWYAPQLKLLL